MAQSARANVMIDQVVTELGRLDAVIDIGVAPFRGMPARWLDPEASVCCLGQASSSFGRTLGREAADDTERSDTVTNCGISSHSTSSDRSI